MQEMKYFNEGNDCDICKNQLMTGRDGTVEDCRRRQNGLSCRFEERDIRTCPVCEHEVDREDMYFTRGLPNARYVYVTAYNPTEEIRWHHHIVMDGDMDMDVVEGCWKQSSRNEVRRLQKDENGLTGMAKYIVEEKNRVKSEKRWNSSQGLRDPDIKVVHSKRPTAKAGGYKKIGTYVETMRKGHEQVREQMLKWYPDFDFTDAGIYYNDFNSMFYIRARMRKRRQQ